jgi:hypothetical protein
MADNGPSPEAVERDIVEQAAEIVEIRPADAPQEAPAAAVAPALPASAAPPPKPLTEEERDQLRASALLAEMTSRRDFYKYAAVYYDWWYYALFVPTIMLSCAATMCGAVWPADKNIRDLMVVVSAIGAVNAITISVSSMLKYQSKSDQCEIAANQYEVLVSKLTFSTQHLIEEQSKAYMMKLVAEIEKRDIDVRKKCPSLPYALEKRFLALEIRARKMKLSAVAPAPSKISGPKGPKIANLDSEPSATASVESNPTEEDFSRLAVLKTNLISRRGTFEHAIVHYQTKLFELLFVSILLSVVTAALASGWEAQSITQYKTIVAAISLANLLVLGALSMFRYQSRMDSATAAAEQYDILVTKVSFAEQYHIGIKRSAIVQLLVDTENADTEIRKNQLSLPHWLESKGIAQSASVEASKLASFNEMASSSANAASGLDM